MKIRERAIDPTVVRSLEQAIIQSRGQNGRDPRQTELTGKRKS